MIFILLSKFFEAIFLLIQSKILNVYLCKIGVCLSLCILYRTRWLHYHEFCFWTFFCGMNLNFKATCGVSCYSVYELVADNKRSILKILLNNRYINLRKWEPTKEKKMNEGQHYRTHLRLRQRWWKRTVLYNVQLMISCINFLTLQRFSNEYLNNK